jgi:hypothetical protein
MVIALVQYWKTFVKQISACCKQLYGHGFSPIFGDLKKKQTTEQLYANKSR